MPSTNARSGLVDRVLTQRNATILAAILVGVPVAYAFSTTFHGDGGDFLLLMTLAVGVPTAYDEYWPAYDRTSLAVAWVLGACAVATAVYVACYLVGTDLLSLSPFLAAVGAFLVTDLGGLALLARRHRRSNE